MGRKEAANLRWMVGISFRQDTGVDDRYQHPNRLLESKKSWHPQYVCSYQSSLVNIFNSVKKSMHNLVASLERKAILKVISFKLNTTLKAN